MTNTEGTESNETLQVSLQFHLLALKINQISTAAVRYWTNVYIYNILKMIMYTQCIFRKTITRIYNTINNT